MSEFLTFLVVTACGSLMGFVIANLLGFTCRHKDHDHDDDNRY